MKTTNYVMWWKKLTIHQKIQMKDCFIFLCGVDFSKLSPLFTYRDKLKIMYNKLIIEKIHITNDYTRI